MVTLDNALGRTTPLGSCMKNINFNPIMTNNYNMKIVFSVLNQNCLLHLLFVSMLLKSWNVINLIIIYLSIYTIVIHMATFYISACIELSLN